MYLWIIPLLIANYPRKPKPNHASPGTKKIVFAKRTRVRVAHLSPYAPLSVQAVILSLPKSIPTRIHRNGKFPISTPTGFPVLPRPGFPSNSAPIRRKLSSAKRNPALHKPFHTIYLRQSYSRYPISPTPFPKPQHSVPNWCYYRMRILCVSLVILSAPYLRAEGNDLFETRVRPVLARNCYACHTESKMGGLQLDSREHVLRGGKSGAAIVPGDPDHSLLIAAVRQTGSLKMPLGGAKLKPDEIETLAAWVKAGAPWPAAPAGTSAPVGYVIRPDQRAFWSFQPVSEPAVPHVKNAPWAKTPIDRFILAKLEEHGLEARAARRSTALCIRRAYFDLTGLPPTPDEVDAFVARQFARRFRQSRRPPARLAALWRALGPLLARCRPLFRRQAQLRRRTSRTPTPSAIATG